MVYLFFPALIFHTLSPVSSICTIRSSTAFATVGSPMASYQLDTGICEVMTMDFLPCLFSMMSSRTGCSLASSGTRKRSSRISSRHRSIFRSSVSIVPLGLCHLQCPQKLRGVCLESANAGLTCLIPQCGGQETLPGTERPGDEEVLRLSDELQRGQPFHLVSVKPAAMPWSFMRFISSRDTALWSFSARTGAVFSFVFIAVSL